MQVRNNEFDPQSPLLEMSVSKIVGMDSPYFITFGGNDTTTSLAVPGISATL